MYRISKILTSRKQFCFLQQIVPERNSTAGGIQFAAVVPRFQLFVNGNVESAIRVRFRDKRFGYIVGTVFVQYAEGFPAKIPQ